MYAVRWTYYGNDSTRTKALASYGTKFASDNWLHKAMGIQLGLTDSLRCQLPEGTDGTGYWALTVYAMGYADYTVEFEATEANIVQPKVEEEVDTTALEKLIAEAEALQEADYTAATWKDMQNELAEAKEAVAEKKSQAVVDEAFTHLNAAVSALVKKPTDKKEEEVDTTALEKLIAEAEALQEADYTETTWKDMQNELAEAKEAVAAKRSQAVVDEALTHLNAAVSALVKKPTNKKPENSNTSKTETSNTETSEVEASTGNETAATAEQKKSVKKGDTYSKSKVTYQVTSTADGKQSVKVTEIKNKKVTEVTIPATVSINGTSYKVTAIAKNAFAGCTKLKKVTIGKNVKTIGKNAFSGASKLKTITIKSKVLTKVGANAFKGIKSNATIKVPSSKVKAYKKLLAGKGQGKKVTITK
jgi:hypothetical protein